MKTSIENFWQQFQYQPSIINYTSLQKDFNYVVVCGMGGSHLAADILQESLLDLHIFVHHDYGLPKLPKIILEQSLYIINSYSGNTEETLSSLKQALDNKYPVLVITTGGKLEQQAKSLSLPYIIMPNTGIQPRAALGLQIKALLVAIGDKKLLSETDSLILNNTKQEEVEGKELARTINQKTPLIYGSAHNSGLCYYWKITLNETAKVPAFCNTFPELNHNEFTGFDIGKNFYGNKEYHVISIKDDDDNQKIRNRMEITTEILLDKDITNSIVNVYGKSLLEKRLRVCTLAMWTAWHLAQNNEAEAEQVPMVETLKHKLSLK